MLDASLGLLAKLRAFLLKAVAAVAALAALAVMAWTGHDGRTDDAMYAALAGGVRSVDAARVDPANEGAVVHLSGAATASAAGVRDDAFGVAVDGIALRRRVEMYQWHETPRGRKANRWHEYTLAWCACRKDSADFAEPEGHANPPLAVEPAVLAAPDARLGAYALPESLLANVAFAHSDDDADAPHPDWSLAPLVERVRDLPPLPDGRVRDAWRVGADGATYVLGDESSPQLGDHRVTYARVKSGEPVSVVGVQRDGAIRGYERAPGDARLLARAGAADAKALIDAQAGVDRVATNVIRAVCALVAALGFGALGTTLHGVIARIPVLKDVAERSRFRGGAALGALLAGILWLDALIG